jgi:hypothetical protein
MDDLEPESFAEDVERHLERFLLRFTSHVSRLTFLTTRFA